MSVVWHPTSSRNFRIRAQASSGSVVNHLVPLPCGGDTVAANKLPTRLMSMATGCPLRPIDGHATMPSWASNILRFLNGLTDIVSIIGARDFL
jgi:hypothetical protein